jgi:methyl-accepting chemotaxis protein
MKKASNKRRDNRSIKTRLIITLLLICVIPVLAIGFISYKKAYSILYSKLQLTTMQNLSQVNKAIDNYFIGMQNIVRMLSNSEGFQQLNIHPDFEQFDWILLKNIQTNNKDILAIYFANNKGKMIASPNKKTPDGYDPTTRPWYENAVKNKGKVVFTGPYKSATAEVFVISISEAVEYNGQVVGVISMDINLSTLSSQLSNIKIGQKGYAFIADGNGVMIAHPDKSTLGIDATGNAKLWNEVKSKASGFTKYVYNGESKFASYETNALTGWKLIASMDESELLADTNIIKNLTLISILVIGILAIFISVLVSNSITKHLFNLKELLEKASDGDLSVKVNINSKDEFEELGNNFNYMLDNINLLVKNVKNSVDTIAQTSGTINVMSNNASKAMNEVALTIDQVAQGTTSQAQDISEGAEAINNLAEKIDNVGNLANEIGTISRDTNNLSEDGLKIMTILTAKTEEANISTNEVTNVIDNMDKSTAEIGLITNTINSIAEQTNLLALNAAIEAARAGESRKLAEQSTYATKQIQSLIEEIKQKSQLAVKSIYNAKLVVTEQTSAVNETKDIFSKILHSVDLLLKKINEIQFSIIDTNKNKDDIVNRIQSISAVSEENSAITEEVSSSTEEVNAVMNEFNHSAFELKEVANQLEDKINNIKLS